MTNGFVTLLLPWGSDGPLDDSENLYILCPSTALDPGALVSVCASMIRLTDGTRGTKGSKVQSQP